MPARVDVTSSLDADAEAWDAIVAQMELPSPFLRSWWLRGLTDSSSVFLLVRDESGLIGGIALQQRRLPLLTVYRFLGAGTLCPDHLDVVAAPAQADVVAEQVRAWAAAGAKLFDLDGVAAGSRLAGWLPHAAVIELEGAPFQPLPETAEQYLAERPRSFRKTVRRARNRFADLEATVHEDADVDRALRAFAQLHAGRGDRGELLAELPRLRRVLAMGVEAGEAHLDVLGTADTTIAVSIAFTSCGRVSLYQTARSMDPELDNSSTVLNLAAVERGIAAGAREVDLLRGGEPYKRHYAEQARPMTRVFGASGLLGRLALAALLGVRRAKRVIRGLRASADGSGSSPPS